MLDLTRTSFGRIFEKKISPGYSVGAEGRVLVSELIDGEEHVRESQGAASEVVCGFSVSYHISPSTFPYIEQAVIPHSSPFTVAIKKNNIVNNSVRVYDVTDATDLTLGNPANSGEYSYDGSSGVFTFNAAQADHLIVIYVRYYPTVIESKSNWYEGFITRTSHDFFGQVGVGMGKSLVFTSEFDTSVDWAAGGVVRAGNGGLVTIGGTGPAVPNAMIIHVPSARDPWLGLQVNI